MVPVLGDARPAGTTAGRCSGQTIYFSFPIALTALIIVVIWAFNVSGMRPAVWVGYVTGALLMLPLAVMMFLPYLTGDWHSANLHNNISATADSLGASSFTLIIVWLYAMCWSAYGMECCATFAPEYHDTARDTPKALRVAAIFGVITYGLLPMGAMGTFGDQNIDISNIYTFMPDTLRILLRRRPGRAGGLLAVRGDRAGDEHRHGRRLASAVRHLPGRHDDPLAGEAEQQARARPTR